MPFQLGDIVLYSTREVSETLGITPQSLRNYIYKRGLKAQKVGGRWFISEDSQREFFGALPRKVPPKGKRGRKRGMYVRQC